MPTMTLAIPVALKQEMDEFPEINWSALARKAFEKSIHDLKILREFTAESTLTEEDAIKFGRELKRRMAKRYMRRKSSSVE